MELTIDRRRLSDELSLLVKVAPRRAPVPVYTCARVVADAEARTLELAATDTRVGMRTILRDVDVVSGGAVLLPLMKVAELVATLGDAPVRLASSGSAVELSSVGYRSTLLTFDLNDYPALPERASSGPVQAFAAATLRGFIKRTEYAVSDHEDARTGGAVITGAHLSVVDGQAWMVATDGHRMAIVQAGVNGLPETECLLSQRLLTAAAGILQDAEGPVEVEVDDRHAFIVAGDRTVFGQLVEGKYPNWRRMVRVHPITVMVPRDPFISALQRARLLSIDSRAILKFDRNAVSVSATEVGVGSGDDQIVVAYDQPPLTVAINAAYVLDYLGAIAAPEVAVSFKDADDALMLRATEEMAASTYVVMPVRL